MAEQNHCHVRYEIPSQTESAGFSHLKDGVMNADKLGTLGWRALVPMEDGITKTIRILRPILNKVEETIRHEHKRVDFRFIL